MKNTRLAKKLSLKKRKWSYRGEGNANLVLALPLERLILRLRKSSHCERNEEEEEERIWRELEFCRGVMLPLLGARFVHVPTVVQLDAGDLLDVNRSLKCLRPAHRHHKGVYFNHGALFPDLCLLPEMILPRWTDTYCVEVKPKQGWIPFPDRRLSRCTFCLNQYLKLHHGSIPRLSDYCPLDLFSGNRPRMKRAIKSLLVCPQNNLKMFKNGVLVYSDTAGGSFTDVLEGWFGFTGQDKLAESLATIVVDALLSDNEEGGLLKGESCCSATQAVSDRIPQALLEEVESLLPGPSCYEGTTEPLPPGCILSRILRVQQLDQCGSDRVHQLLSELPSATDYGYVDELLHSPCSLLSPINSYLLATTAKDCSLLISYQQTSSSIDSSASLRDINNTRYVFGIGVSDLDPKPLSCIDKHRVRDNDVVLSCIDVLRRKQMP